MRRGNWTLQIVVIAVILLATAAILVVFGGSSIIDMISQSGEQGTTSSVASACNDLGETIDQYYCERYMNAESSGCTDDVRKYSSLNYDVKPSQRNCQWTEYTGGDGVLGTFMNEGQPRVTVDGDTYNCLTQGHLSPTCPAN